MEVLDIKKLAVVSGATKILQVDSFTLQRGDICYIDGHSGSGKSIFFKSLIRLLPITYQKFHLNSQDVNLLKPQDLRLKVMYLNQQPQLPLGKVNDFLKLVFAFEHNKNLSRDNHRLFFTYHDILCRNDALGNLDTSNLSGGEIQMIQICLALVLCQEILILDEAFSAMDRATHYKAERLVHEWVNQVGTDRSIIFTSHQPELSLFKPDTTYVMNHGRLEKI